MLVVTGSRAEEGGFDVEAANRCPWRQTWTMTWTLATGVCMWGSQAHQSSMCPVIFPVDIGPGTCAYGHPAHIRPVVCLASQLAPMQSPAIAATQCLLHAPVTQRHQWSTIPFTTVEGMGHVLLHGPLSAAAGIYHYTGSRPEPACLLRQWAWGLPLPMLLEALVVDVICPHS